MMCQGLNIFPRISRRLPNGRRRSIKSSKAHEFSLPASGQAPKRLLSRGREGRIVSNHFRRRPGCACADGRGKKGAISGRRRNAQERGHTQKKCWRWSSARQWPPEIKGFRDSFPTADPPESERGRRCRTPDALARDGFVPFFIIQISV